VTVSCIFGDWEFSWMAEPRYTFRAGSRIPLKWLPTWGRPSEVKLTDAIGTDVEWMALTTHWAQEHRELLEAILGEHVEVAGFPRARPPAN
jgi:hypothetical protein